MEKSYVKQTIIDGGPSALSNLAPSLSFIMFPFSTQTLNSHLKMYAPSAYINIPIDFPLASHYQDLFIPIAPH